MDPLIEVSELIACYHDKSLVLIDASSGTEGKKQYADKHPDKALYVDLNTDLSHIKNNAAEGGRHPLPSVDEFLATLQKLGINNDSHVVIYDSHYGANAASRLWWMLKAIGHEKVQVLNGGKAVLEKSGLPMTDQAVESQKVKAYNAEHWQLPLANLEEVKQHAEDHDYHIIDVRESKRYKGEIEPIDLIAGHIPGAMNIPFSENLDDAGNFLPPEVLKEKYSKLYEQVQPTHTIVHCGSGVTACHTLLAMAYAGLPIPKLYVGSWSEWSRNGLEIVTDQ